MQMHILSDSQHKELTQAIGTLQSILGGSINVSLDSKPAGATISKAPAETATKVTRSSKSRRDTLTAAKVLRIKRKLADGKESIAQIAKEFHVQPNTIYCIKWGKTWKHVQLQQDNAPASVDA